MTTAPTLLNSCAKAASAAEARYRMDRPNARARDSRIVALDSGAAELMRRVAGPQGSDPRWRGARFLTFVSEIPLPGFPALPMDAMLRGTDGALTTLGEELVGADQLVMIATGKGNAKAATVIGNACRVRGIMTAGLVVKLPDQQGDGQQAVTAMRPFAAVLVVAGGEEYVPEMLSALRA